MYNLRKGNRYQSSTNHLSDHMLFTMTFVPYTDHANVKTVFIKTFQEDRVM